MRYALYKYKVYDILVRQKKLLKLSDFYFLTKDINEKGNTLVAIKSLRNMGLIQRYYFGNAKTQAAWGLPAWFDKSGIPLKDYELNK